MTAEFAVALPAVLLLLALLLSVVRLGASQVVAQDAAADAARSLGRGDTEATVFAQVQDQLPGARWTISREAPMICVVLIAPATGPARALGVEAAGRACALAGGA